jgi:hypothetical protein
MRELPVLFPKSPYMQVTTLRAHLESVLGERLSTPFTDLTKRVHDAVPFGIDVLDKKIGGLPRGAVTEIFGLPSSGKTSMLLSILAAATARDEVCALVDGNDAFSPESGAKAGIDLKRLLWTRCHNVDQTLKVTDLLLQSGGFGVVALDISDLQVQSIQAVPLSTWFRFQRAIEKTPTILTILSLHGAAKTCASLAIHLENSSRRFTSPPLSFTRFLGNDGVVPITADIVRNRQSYRSQSHVRFSLHSEFFSPGARP